MCKFISSLFVLCACLLSSCHTAPNNNQITSHQGLEFLDTLADVGTVSMSDPIAYHDFRFVNHKPNPIVILDVRTSCECTTVEYDTTPVQSGDTSYIRAIYNGTDRSPEFFSKTIYVYTSASDEDVCLELKGELK